MHLLAGSCVGLTWCRWILALQVPGLCFAQKIRSVEGVDLTASILEEGEQVLVKTQQRGFMLELLYALQQVVLVKPAMCYL